MRLIIGVAALALLAACGGDEQANGGVTAEESTKLNEAAEMLDASPDSLVATEDSELGNGDMPAQEGAPAAEAPAPDNGY